MGLDDEVFVARCLEGDQAAFTCLVTEYKEMVHAYAYHKLGDCQQAEDITQEVFIKAYRNLAQLKWPHKFRSWLYTIASNECKLWLREHSREYEREVFWEDVPADKLNELAVRNHSEEDINLTVKSAMETLPDDRQLALTLFYMSGLSVREIAYFMGISPSNVKVKLHRARKQLGERLEKMIGKHLSKEKLKAGFVFRFVESIRDMPIPSLPKPLPTKWAPIPISVGIALLVGIIGYGVSAGKDVPQSMDLLTPVETSFTVSLLTDSDEQRALDRENSGESQLAALYGEDDSAEEAGESFEKGIAVRKVPLNVNLMGGPNISPSPDGRYLSFANGENGNLAILDINTGESRDLTDEGNWEGAQSHAISSAWSPDSKQIACWWSGGDHKGLRIIGLDGSQPRDLYKNTDDLRPSDPWINGCYDWSGDGKYILAKSARRTDENKRMQDIVLVSAADSSVRILKSQASAPMGMTLSPDGRYVVYDRPVKEHEDLRDIFVLTTDGSGEETRLTEHPADDFGPLWSPDGRSIVFASNRAPDGTVGLWFTQIVDGKAVGEPQLIKREAGDVLTLGFTQKGSLFYVTMTSWSDIYVASLDMETGQVLEPPTPLLHSQGLNTMPAWSPDGESLAYVSQRPLLEGYGSRMVLMIRSMKTGEEREILSIRDSLGPGPLHWSPDGRSILYGWPWEPLRLIDIETGHITTIAMTDSRIWGPTWSPDSKTIYYTGVDLSNEAEGWPGRIVALDLETRKERELYPGVTMGTYFLAVSPDGRQLAFRDKDRMIKVIPTEGGESRILLEDKDQAFYAPFAWTPDGHYVLFTAGTDQPDNSIQQLWRIPAEGGIPKKLLEASEMLKPFSLHPLSLHPDGRRIAFQKGKRRQVDLWVMENLLPPSTVSR